MEELLDMWHLIYGAKIWIMIFGTILLISSHLVSYFLIFFP